MSSTLDISRYHVARRFLQEGRRDWTLVLIGELLHTDSGHPLALSLLTDMYSETSGARAPDGAAAMPPPGLVAALTSFDQGV